MSRVIEKVKEEFLAILPATAFFFVSLHLVAVIRTLMARGTAYTPLSTFAIAISALILGKAVLIADPRAAEPRDLARGANAAGGHPAEAAREPAPDGARG